MRHSASMSQINYIHYSNIYVCDCWQKMEYFLTFSLYQWVKITATFSKYEERVTLIKMTDEIPRGLVALRELLFVIVLNPQ